MPPEAPPSPLRMITELGPRGGPSYRYKAATIHADWTGRMVELDLPGGPGPARRRAGSLEVILWFVDLFEELRSAGGTARA